MLNASIPLFQQHLVPIVYEYPLGLGFVSLSIKIAFVNLEKALKCFFISSGLLAVHTSVFRMVVVKSFRSFLKIPHSNSKRSVCRLILRAARHDGASLVLKRCRHVFMLPCPVTVRVNLVSCLIWRLHLASTVW